MFHGLLSAMSSCIVWPPALFPAVVMGSTHVYAVRGVSVIVSFIAKTWISFHLDVRSSSWTRGRVTVYCSQPCRTTLADILARVSGPGEAPEASVLGDLILYQ